jgi:hypothetical protein
VWLGAVSRVAALRHGSPGQDPIPQPDAEGAASEVREEHDGAAGRDLDGNVIARDSGGAERRALGLTREVGQSSRERPAGFVVGFTVMGEDDGPLDGSEDGLSEPVKASGGSVARNVRQVTGAVRPRSSTATKSIACEEPNADVPWLGTRRAGLLRATQRPVNGSSSMTGAITRQPPPDPP